MKGHSMRNILVSCGSNLLFAIILLSVTAAATALAAPTYTLENQQVADTAVRGIMYPAWSHDNLKVAYLASPARGIGEIRVFDLKTGTTLRVAGNTAFIRDGRIAWSPDDSSILFLSRRDATEELDDLLILAKCSATVPDQVTFDLVKPSQLGVTFTAGLGDPSVTQTETGWKLIVGLTDWTNYLGTEGIYVMDIDPSGTPDPSTARKVLGIPWGLFQNPSLSSDGNRMLLHQPWTYTDRNLWIVDELQDILNGRSEPITSFDDPRMHRVDTTDRYVMHAEFSQDDSLIFFSEDMTGNFNETLGNYDSSDFDVAIVRTADAIAGTPQATYVATPGTQGLASASRGGPRISYVDWSAAQGGKLYFANLKVSETPDTVDGVVQSDYFLYDGSGTWLKVAAGTRLSGYSGQPVISISTPYTPVSEPEVPLGVQGIPVVREFAPTGMRFEPAATLQLHYTDAEVAGQDEAMLQVYEFNTLTGQYDLPMPILTREPDLNTISAAIGGFSHYGMGAETDTDADGVTDNREALLGTDPHATDTDRDGLTDSQEINWDTNPAYSPYNPTTNPTGTDTNPLLPDTDGDGISDGQEATSGSSPVDANDLPPLPASTAPGLVLLATVLATFAAVRIAFRNEGSLLKTDSA